MTPRQISNIYSALGELGGIVLPYKLSRKLAGLIRAVRREYETVVSGEDALIEKYGGKRTGNGISFGDVDTAQAFGEAFEKYCSEDDESISFSPVDISAYTAQLNISPRAVDTLDGVVIFEREGRADGK